MNNQFWQNNIRQKSTYQNNFPLPAAVYSLPYGYELQNLNNFVFLSPILVPKDEYSMPTENSPPTANVISQYPKESNGGYITTLENTTDGNTNKMLPNTISLPNENEINSKLKQHLSVNAFEEQEISLIKQLKADQDTLKHLKETRELTKEEQKENLNNLVVGVPRVPKASSNAPKKVKLIFSETVRWKKVQAFPKREDGVDQSIDRLPQSPQRKKRRKSLKTCNVKQPRSKRTKLELSDNYVEFEGNDIANDFDFADDEAALLASNSAKYKYGNPETKFEIENGNVEYKAESEAHRDDKTEIIRNTNTTPCNILDVFEKTHSAKNFRELAAENDDIKAFTTIKDLAERMTKEDAEMGFDHTNPWDDQPSTEAVMFSLDDLKYSDPHDEHGDEELVLENLNQNGKKLNNVTNKTLKKGTTREKKKVKRLKTKKEIQSANIDISVENSIITEQTPLWPLAPLGEERSQIFSEFTKKGKRRKRLPRRDLRQYLPKVNPILQKEGDSSKNASPKTLDDYIVVRSAKAPRKAYTKYNTLENPDFDSQLCGLKNEDDEYEDEAENTPDEHEEDENSVERSKSQKRKNKVNTYSSNANDTYEGESQEDVESDGDSQDDAEDTPKEDKVKKKEGNNNEKLLPEFAAMHADRNTYGCIFCNYMAPKKEWLIHLKRKHRDKNLVFCTFVKFCNMPFEFMKDLDAHIEEIHSKHKQTGPRFRDVKSYIEFEGEENNDDSREHQRTPKKVERTAFSCQFCDFRGIKRQWVLHLKTKHAEKHLVFCEFSRNCSLPFDNQEMLDNHIQSFHLTNTCDICGQEFKYRNVLREHKKIHIPEVITKLIFILIYHYINIKNNAL